MGNSEAQSCPVLQLLGASHILAPWISLTQDIEQLGKAAEQGDAETQFSLGRIYFFGLGVPRDPKEAVKWYTLAAEQGNPLAQWRLGLFHMCVPPLVSWTDQTHQTQKAGCKARRWRA